MDGQEDTQENKCVLRLSETEMKGVWLLNVPTSVPAGSTTTPICNLTPLPLTRCLGAADNNGCPSFLD